MMAPSLVGVEVPAGRHVVRFEYEPYGHYPLLLGIGALTLLGLVIFPRRAALRLPRSLRGNREPGDALRRRLSERAKPLR